MGIKFRLIVMNFLQYAIWGSWLISLGAYLGGGLDFTGLQIGSFFATMGIASLFMPAVMGIIADRWIPAQKAAGHLPPDQRRLPRGGGFADGLCAFV